MPISPDGLDSRSNAIRGVRHPGRHAVHQQADMAIIETPADMVDAMRGACCVRGFGVSCDLVGKRGGGARPAWQLNAGNGTLIDWPVAAPAARTGD